ncbi:ornithine carbamoyltransferase [Bacillus salipaludis]|uniref:Ornithine carbamoyltransferase n=1 Tax=Bacillus salipaludis TaxID=2547811 RepID=A0A4R5VMA6_9BACI|nr:ornithine carbamoyltransferase [Bacillus salipaludis]MDQ6596194.1 ornithine carbamoyltransferase [Bacillus salipaludis]TDK59044.1 ornithine carbamoyltransferase [Bacillus salipaludis]
MIETMQKNDSKQFNFKGKNFLQLSDFTTDEILYLLDVAVELKAMQKQGKPHPYLSGQVLGMIFDKSSTRTRVSFEVGMMQLGGQAIFLSSKDSQLGRGESISDTAKVLSRYVDALMIRTFTHESIEEFAHHAEIPVINGLTDLQHPTQVMADLLTILEHKGKLAGLKMCYIGDGYNNMAHSLLEGALKVGIDISIASPEGYMPNQTIVENAKQIAKETGAQITITHNPVEAIQNADVVVTDVWTSMGQEAETEKRLKAFEGFQVNGDLCKHAKSDFIFLHCLPAHRGEEVTADLIDGPHSVVFDEAENRLHAQKAILKEFLQK